MITTDSREAAIRAWRQSIYHRAALFDSEFALEYHLGMSVSVASFDDIAATLSPPAAASALTEADFDAWLKGVDPQHSFLLP